MFPYTVKYTESESDIQITNLLFKTHKTCQNTLLKNTNISRKSKTHIFRKFRFQNYQRFMAINLLWRIYSWTSFSANLLLGAYCIDQEVKHYDQGDHLGPYTIYDKRYTLYDIRYTKSNIRNTKYNNDIRYTIYEIRHTLYDIRNTIYDIRNAKYFNT